MSGQDEDGGVHGGGVNPSPAGGHFMPRDPVTGRGHLGGAGKYIEMDRLDKVVNMEEGSRSLHTELPEMLGGRAHNTPVTIRYPRPFASSSRPRAAVLSSSSSPRCTLSPCRYFPRPPALPQPLLQHRDEQTNEGE